MLEVTLRVKLKKLLQANEHHYECNIYVVFIELGPVCRMPICRTIQTGPSCSNLSIFFIKLDH